MTGAGPLQAAIHARLAADAALAGLLGGARVHDTPPRAAAIPYVALGAWATRPFDTAEAAASEHRFEIRVVSRQGGRREATAIAERVAAVLEATPPLPAGHRLANLRLVARTVGEGGDGRSFAAVMVFRAVTEPAG